MNIAHFGTFHVRASALTLIGVLMLMTWFTASALAAAQTPTWTQLPNTPGPNNVRHDDVYFIDAANGWAVQNHYIYRTTNGGGTWTTNLFLAGTHFRSVAFATRL